MKHKLKINQFDMYLYCLLCVDRRDPKTRSPDLRVFPPLSAESLVYVVVPVSSGLFGADVCSLKQLCVVLQKKFNVALLIFPIFIN